MFDKIYNTYIYMLCCMFLFNVYNMYVIRFNTQHIIYRTHGLNIIYVIIYLNFACGIYIVEHKTFYSTSYILQHAVQYNIS